VAEEAAHSHDQMNRASAGGQITQHPCVPTLHPLRARSTTGARSRWGKGSHGNGYLMGDADVFNDHVSKGGKNRHRFESHQTHGLRKEWLGS
jgi:hypothetical protein